MLTRRSFWVLGTLMGIVLLLLPFLYRWPENPLLVAEPVGAELYACPMHPEVQSQTPGERCHLCGMELVRTVQAQERSPFSPQPVAVEGSHPMPEQQPSGQEGKAASEGAQHGSGDGASSAAPQRAPIQLSPGQQQLIGVTYGTVEKRPLTRVIRTVGRVEYDERKLAEVTLKIAGWIQDLYADYTGKLVKKGQPLFTLYSPDLVTAQEEYLLALRTQEQLKNSRVPGALESAESLVRVSRNRLLLWDLTAAQIRALEESGKPQLYQTIYSPLGGFIIDKTAFKGHRVEPGMTLYKIADLSTVWVYADIYEYELPFVQVGQEAKVSLSYYPREVFTATVTYLYPYLDEKTRTGKVRFELANTPDWKLKPAMYATTELEVQLGEKLVIPEPAVLDAGVRQIVFVDKGQGRFAPQEVKLGDRVDHYVEVLGGLTAGERVVTSGNFLVDSESKLQAAESMMGMMGAIGMGDWKMESAKPMEMGGGLVAMAGPQEKTVGNLKLRVSTAPEPAKLGDNTLRIEVTDAQGQPVTDATVALEYTMDMPGMMIDKAQASHTRGGVYEAKVRFTMAGPWGVTVSVQRPGQAAVRERFTVNASQ
jgi:Cu(I)/Ag(I) efflux system membrane fusion protein